MGCSFIAPIQKAAGAILRPVATVAAIIPGPWQVPALAAKAVDSAVHGDYLGAALAGAGAYGAGGGFSDAGFDSSSLTGGLGGGDVGSLPYEGGLGAVNGSDLASDLTAQGLPSGLESVGGAMGNGFTLDQGMLSGAGATSMVPSIEPNLISTPPSNFPIDTVAPPVAPTQTAGGSLFDPTYDPYSDIGASQAGTVNTGLQTGLPSTGMTVTGAAPNINPALITGGALAGGSMLSGVSNAPPPDLIQPVDTGALTNPVMGITPDVSNAGGLLGLGTGVSNSLVNAGLGLAGSYLNQQATQDSIAAQNAASAAAQDKNLAYARELDALKQARLGAATTKSEGLLTGLGATTNDYYQSQIDAARQGQLSDIGLGGMAAKYESAARNAQSSSLMSAASTAADMAKFTPYGITNNFGSSDTSGNTKLNERFQSQFDTLYGQSNDALARAGLAYGQTAPMAGSAARMFELGQGYLATSPQEQAAKYYQDQMNLLTASRESDLANTESRLQARGRLGLAVGGTSNGMMAANPELAALYNARRQQELGLASQATLGGQQYAQFGANMIGTGGKTLQDMYGIQAAAYDPYKQAMAGMQNLQGEVQKNAVFGADLGQKRAVAGAQAGQLYQQGATAAAEAAYRAQADARQYADYIAAQQAAVEAQTPLQKAMAQNKSAYETGLMGYKSAEQMAQTAATSAGSITQAPWNQPAGVAPAVSPLGSMLTGAASQNTSWFGG